MRTGVWMYQKSLFLYLDKWKHWVRAWSYRYLRSAKLAQRKHGTNYIAKDWVQYQLMLLYTFDSFRGRKQSNVHISYLAIR